VRVGVACSIGSDQRTRIDLVPQSRLEERVERRRFAAELADGNHVEAGTVVRMRYQSEHRVEHHHAAGARHRLSTVTSV